MPRQRFAQTSLQHLMPSTPTTANHPNVDMHVIQPALGSDLPHLAMEHVLQKHDHCDRLLRLEVCSVNQQASPTEMWICHAVARSMAAACAFRLTKMFEVLQKQFLQTATQSVLSELNPLGCAVSHTVSFVVRHLVLRLAKGGNMPLTWVEETLVHQVP